MTFHWTCLRAVIECVHTVDAAAELGDVASTRGDAGDQAAVHSSASL